LTTFQSMSLKTKQFKDYKEKIKWVDEQTEKLTNDYLELAFFNKFVPKWLQWLMKKTPWLVRRLAYEINHLDGDYNKLIISRKTLFTGKFKLIAKSF